MYQYFIDYPIIATIFTILVVAVVIFVLVKLSQTIGMESIRKAVYDGFVEAEHEFKYGDNSQKFEYVIRVAREALPKPFSTFITESFLRKAVQLWFNLCKDLLDDGKLNGSEESSDDISDDISDE